MTSDDEDKRELSPVRITVALLLLIGLLGGGAALVIQHVRNDTVQAAYRPAPAWFAPYVDVTLTPTYSFQDPAYNPSRQAILGFLVASKSAPCAPSWGGVYTLAQAGTSLDLDRRIVQYRERNGEPIVSFGGAANTELALSCSHESSLAAAYMAVIKRYDLTTIDFDLEGGALTDSGSIYERAVAVAAIEREESRRGRSLSVWLTLPAEPTGLAPGSLAVIKAMLAVHDTIAGVNVLAMDFGTKGKPVTDMLGAAEQSLTSAESQVLSLYTQAGVKMSATSAWNHLGATLMIGQNDFPGERFTIAEAHKLLSFVSAHDIGRVSFWSLNRDNPCGSYYPETGIVSSTCSGAVENPLGFTQAFSSASASPPSQGSATTTTSTFPPAVRDSASTSPYPVWQATESYPANYKVVWQGSVYEAKWFNAGAAPNTPTTSAATTPWLLVGPVLPTDHAPRIPTLPPGTYPAWSPSKSYAEGARVLMDGLPYSAKWFNVGAQPGADPADPAVSPWHPLFAIPGEPAGSS